MPYWRFLVANVLGGILWAGGTTAVIYSVGIVAEPWLKRFSWLALVIALLIGLVVTLVMRSRMKKAVATARAEASADSVPAAP
jgi:membrane protein DedA with SNARE-associated domain